MQTEPREALSSSHRTPPRAQLLLARLSDGLEDEDVAVNDGKQGEEEDEAEEQHGVGADRRREAHVVPGARGQQTFGHVGTWEAGAGCSAFRAVLTQVPHSAGAVDVGSELLKHWPRPRPWPQPCAAEQRNWAQLGVFQAGAIRRQLVKPTAAQSYQFGR